MAARAVFCCFCRCLGLALGRQSRAWGVGWVLGVLRGVVLPGGLFPNHRGFLLKDFGVVAGGWVDGRRDGSVSGIAIPPITTDS